MVLSGKAKREDSTYLIKWIDGTDKIIRDQTFRYDTTGTLLSALGDVAQLCRLNEGLLEIKMKTI